MKFSVVAALVLLSLVNCAVGHEDHGGHYKFSYGVSDPHTKDKKEQYEQRDGHVVKGYYTLAEADGTHRVVDYVSGPHSGFNAVVKRIGHAVHPQHYGHGHGGSGYGGHPAHSWVGVTHYGYGGH